MSKISKYIKNVCNQDLFEEGYAYVILANTENTQYPDRYSESVFAWYEDGTLKITLEFQEANGGDPIVLKKYLLKEVF